MLQEIPSAQEIEYFQVLREHGHMTRASEELGVTQPTLSSALKRLEEKLGVNLFVRTKKGLELTPEGGVFGRRADALIDQFKDLGDQLKASVSGLKSHYLYGIHPSVAIICLPTTMPDIAKEYPELSFKFHHGVSREINEKIISKEIDFGIVVNPTSHPDLILKKICNDEVKVFRAIGAKKSETLVYDSKLFQSSFIVNKLKSKGLHYKRYLELGSLELIRELGISEVGDVILPTRVANRPQEKARFKEVSNTPMFKDEFFFVWNSTKSWNKAEREFLRKVAALLKDKIS